MERVRATCALLTRLYLAHAFHNLHLAYAFHQVENCMLANRLRRFQRMLYNVLTFPSVFVT